MFVAKKGFFMQNLSVFRPFVCIYHMIYVLQAEGFHVLGQVTLTGQAALFEQAC